MQTKRLQTESYQTKGKQETRHFPFFELEYNEWVIFEDDIPSYYLEINEEPSSNNIIKSVKQDLGQYELREVTQRLGKQLNKHWDIYHSDHGHEVDAVRN